MAVIRVSGPGAGRAVEALARGRPEPRRAVLRKLRRAGSGEVIDEALVLWLPGPGSYSGEDMAEFQVHGGRAVISAVLGALGELETFRPAEAGEFTRRAFLNGRLDLVAAEGLADLIDSETEAQRRQAQFHYGGGASRVFEEWRAEVIAVLARLEAAIDFVEEEGVAEAALEGVTPRIAALERKLREGLEDARRGERIREGIRVVLAGPPNAGKSSILNKLARRDAAIVSAIPGTTRDVIEVHLDLAGLAVIVADTAGLRSESGNEIEAEGMARSRSRMAEADVVLWVTSPDVGHPGPPAALDSAPLWVCNKSDLLGAMAAAPGQALAVSAKTGDGMDELVAKLTARVAREFEG
ncbi:MAG: tRNA uridine-5-carboxymethylaminomethyl(34) synthesis GTPase MnmE, partial [Candidatus Rokubacteria bacterium]|nr:tRNA uridine-5-carboxymethylaminomethyl(34) synthesis GTPase MnmE [Candidatus Rokubacteria bacterium]